MDSTGHTRCADLVRMVLRAISAEMPTGWLTVATGRSPQLFAGNVLQRMAPQSSCATGNYVLTFWRVPAWLCFWAVDRARLFVSGPICGTRKFVRKNHSTVRFFQPFGNAFPGECSRHTYCHLLACNISVHSVGHFVPACLASRAALESKSFDGWATRGSFDFVRWQS